MPTLLGIKDGTRDASYGLEKRDKISVLKKQWKIDYYVLADSTLDTEDDILATAGIPSLFSFWNFAWVKGYKAKELQSVIHPVTGVLSVVWQVTVELDSSIDQADDEEDPTNRTPAVRWSGETEDELLEEDPITGDPIQTDADEPIILTTPVVMPVLEIKRYELYPFDPTIMLAYSHRTNSTTFWGAPAGSALMLPMEVDEETIEGVKYCNVTYRIKFKIKPSLTEPWKARLLHHGFKYRPAAGKPPQAAQDKHGNPITVNLVNGTGEKVADGDPPEYKEFNRFAKVNFNALALGPF